MRYKWPSSVLHSLVLVFGALVVPNLPAVAQEQNPHERRGLFGRIGIGPGRLDFNCGPAIVRGTLSTEDCIQNSRGRAGLGYIDIGYAFSQYLSVGVEFVAWGRQRSVDGGHLRAVTLHYYPSAVSGFFLDVGVGTSSFVSPLPGFDERGSGWGLIGGLGYDLRATRSNSLTFELKSLYSDQGTVGAPIFRNTSGIDYATRTDVSQFILAFVFGFTVH